MSRAKNGKGKSKVSVGEAASRVGMQVYHTGQGQDERGVRAKFLHGGGQEREEVVDAQINQLRAQLIQELMQMGEAGEWSAGPAEGRPRCERCATVLVARGKQTRFLQTNGGEAIKLERSYGTCPECGQGIFPPG